MEKKMMAGFGDLNEEKEIALSKKSEEAEKSAVAAVSTVCDALDTKLDEAILTQVQTKTYAKRWLILILFVLYSMSNAFQWIQYSIIGSTVIQYYNVSQEMVDWTSYIYMFVYIPLIFPATYLLEAKGLRWAVLLGSFGTCLGSWIKVFSAAPDRFWLAFIGQATVAVSQIFILGIPPFLAAVWFGPDQVSTATSIGVFGNQLGVALGFLLPTMLVRNGTTEEIGNGFATMYYGTGAFTAAIFVCALLVFQDKPPLPPSLAQAAFQSKESEGYLLSIKRLLSNKGYIFLLLSYGMNVGVFYAISTLLESFIIKYWPGHEEDVGRIGLCIVLSGMVGSVISGLILDKSRKYKETTAVVYCLSLVGMVAYTFTLPYSHYIVFQYIVMASLGFFMTGYLPVGFEFAAEITYPESEGTSSGLLNASAQIFGLILTPITRAIFQTSVGDMGANLLLTGVLGVGLTLTLLIKPDLRRLRAQNPIVEFVGSAC